MNKLSIERLFVYSYSLPHPLRYHYQFNFLMHYSNLDFDPSEPASIDNCGFSWWEVPEGSDFWWYFDGLVL